MRHDMNDLLTLMQVLRDREQGCPWDLQQDELPGELGDLLFQVVYYAQFGAEEQRFDFDDVVDTLTAKMLRRHPHVFPEGTLASRRPPGVSAEEVQTQQVNSRWESLKAEERAERAVATPSVLDDVPRTLPALSRAAKLSKRAARVGFDWPDAKGVVAKIREELAEVEEALAAGDQQHAQEEVGDLLFAVTNLARTLNADPEQCLRATNAKFERRFRYVEGELSAAQRPLAEASLDEMETHWQAAKAQEKQPTHS